MRTAQMDQPRALMDVLLRPIAEQRDSVGRRSYAAFLLGLRNFKGLHRLQIELADLGPISGHFSDLLTSSIPHLTEPLFSNRMIPAYTIFLCTLVDWDRREPDVRPALLEVLMIGDAIDLATAVMTARCRTRSARDTPRGPTYDDTLDTSRRDCQPSAGTG